MAFAAFVVVGYWAFRHPISYDVKHPLDLAIVAAAMAGACVGFLWWNAPPARIFMGDTGSLAIGTAMGGLAMLLHVDLLLPVIGGLYVIETASVNHPGRLVPALRSPPVPDGPHAPSPRAGGVAGDHRAHPPLGREQPARGTRSRPLLRRLLESRSRRAAGRLAVSAEHLSDARRPMLDALRPDDGPVLVVGMGVTGCAVAMALGARDHEIIVADDRPDAAAARVASAGLASVEIHDSTDHDLLSALVSNAAVVIPSPGVPPRHPSYTLADSTGVPVVSELDLAAQWDNRPLAAITGTNGKTTVTVLTERMLNRSGISALGAGNTDVALVDAIDRDVSTFVVEASSFRLHRARNFAPAVAAWLNLAPDHLDWHVDLRDYAASKARIWAAQGPDDVAVVPFDDPDVEPWTSGIRSRRVTFATPQSLDAACDVRYEHGVLVAHHTALVAVAELPRRRPHDLSNAAAAAANRTGDGGLRGGSGG